MAEASKKSFIVRSMTAEDLPAARDLWANTSGIELAEGDGPGQLASYLLRNPETSLVAVSGERVIGAVLAGHDGRRGLMYHLAVATDQRRSGIARQLVDRSLSALKAAGITRVLILVAHDNEVGKLFWERCSFESLRFANPMGINL
jgi:ribosomal protein S18 acetylase RimI-like enzyme